MKERDERDDAPGRGRERPPGHFMDERLADDTARFLAEVKRLAERRRRPDDRDGWARPPDGGSR